MSLFYLGPKGTFSYLAALKYEKDLNQLIPKENLYEVIQAVQANPQSKQLSLLKMQ